MSDDLHTSTILNAALLEALRLINTSVETLKVGISNVSLNSVRLGFLLKYLFHLNNFKKKLQKKQQITAFRSLIELEREVKTVLDIFGLLPNLTYSEVIYDSL